MARNKLKKWFFGLAAALGITATSFGVHEVYENKHLEKDIDDLELPQKINSKEEPKIDSKNEIKETKDKEISNKEKVVINKEKKESKKVDKKTVSDSSKDKSLVKENINIIYVDDLIIPIIKNFETPSIIDALNEVGYDSSLAARARLAVYFNIVTNENEFKGTEEQNPALLDCLREYARNLQNTIYNDYGEVLNNQIIENSIPDSNNNESISNDTEDNKEDNKDKDDKDKDKDKPGKHKHKWGAWTALNDEKEYHKCLKCGKQEEQDHPSYGDWYDNGNDTKSRTCDNCSHTMTENYVWSNWTGLDNDYEHRFREDGEEEKQKHPYGEWTDNGNDEEKKTCPNCGNVVTRKKHQHNCVEQAPVSLNATDEENCQAIYFKCPDDDYIDESLTKFILHDLPNTPEDVLDDEGLYRCNTCGMEIIKKIEIPPHEHHPEQQAPESLNCTNEEYCAVIYSKCPDDDYIDESLTEFLPHNLPETPEDVLGDEGLFKCERCGMEIIKEITGTKTEEDNSNVSDDQEIEFDPSPEDENEYSIVEEEQDTLDEVDFEDINDNLNEETEENNLDDDILLLEDKSANPLIEDHHKDLQSVLKTFDTELYTKLFKKRVELEQSLLANNEGIKKEENIRLLNYIDAIKANMVQELATALVQDELKRMDVNKLVRTFKA